MNAKCLQQRERSFRAAEQKTTQKGYGICIPEELTEEKEEKATVEESVRPCTTLGATEGPNLISALERNFEIT